MKLAFPVLLAALVALLPAARGEDKEAPADWGFQIHDVDQQALQRFVTETGAVAHRVPYRQNRAVIFNSDLIHRTDEIRFRPGYENRRINVTFLYGERIERV